MSLYLDTSRRGQVAIGLCDRCKTKYSVEELMSDPNTPGLRVCKECCDVFDPWRLPPRATEDITVWMPRPETPVPMNLQYSVTVAGVVGSFSAGETILGLSSGVTALYVSLVGATLTVKEVQGLSFRAPEIVQGQTSGASAQIVTEQGTN